MKCDTDYCNVDSIVVVIGGGGGRVGESKIVNVCRQTAFQNGILIMSLSLHMYVFKFHCCR